MYWVGGNFTVVTRYQYIDVGEGLLNNSIVLIPATITSYYVHNTNCDTVGEACALYITFKLINNVPTRAGRGRITITLPSQISVSIYTC